MCGVAFAFHPDPAVDVGGACRRMVAALGHRGPDASDVRRGPGWALGHARLRVIDTSARADQPFGDPRSGWLSYNGELDDFEALRIEGASYATRSDTEVLLRLLEQRGEAALDDVRGMFAFVYVEPTGRRVLLARDRVGIKPLFFARVGDGVLVASEVKGVLAAGWLSPRLDARTVHQVLRFNHPLGTRTAFEGVEAVAPGTVVTFDLERGDLEVCRYHRWSFRRPAEASFARRVEDVNARFEAAVARRLVADRPVAAYSSGGIDSAGVVAEMRRHGPVTAYTMTFPDAPRDERRTAARLARRLDLHAVEVAVRTPTLEDLSRYVWAAEMPQQWTSDLALLRLADRVAHPVVLTGEGPDELLAGYDVYRAMRLHERLAWARPDRLARLPFVRSAALRTVAPWLALDADALSTYLAHHAAGARASRRERLGFTAEGSLVWDLCFKRQRGVFGEALVDAYDARCAADDAELVAAVGQHVLGASALEGNLYFEATVRLPNWVLHMGDRVSASRGLELRFPYLDDDLVGALFALPEEDRLRGLVDKRILRAMHRRRLDARVCRQKKEPLYAPIRPWLAGFFASAEIERYWCRDALAPWFEWAGIERLRTRVIEGRFDGVVDRMTAEWTVMVALTTAVLSVRAGVVA